MSFLSTSLLAQTIDDHIAWMRSWTRAAFYEVQNHAARAESMLAPASFSVWRSEAAKSVQDQPALDRLVAHYDQLHRMARLVLLKAPEGESVPVGDYDAVATKYEELVLGLRRFERALSTAESGLDTLTGLRSRTGMRDDLTRELRRFERTNKPFCIAMLDLDHFKRVNDTYGHENGDKVLSAVADYIGRTLRAFDDAWRWGGEEILMCLKEADIQAGVLAMERLRSGLEKLPIRLDNGNTICVTASIGLVSAAINSNIDEMLIQVDKALYRAKAAGRNRIEAG
jgi:diguanylate cyclase (GGDEF)-like protein